MVGLVSGTVGLVWVQVLVLLRFVFVNVGIWQVVDRWLLGLIYVCVCQYSFGCGCISTNTKTCTQTSPTVPETNPTITVAYGWIILILLLHFLIGLHNLITAPNYFDNFNVFFVRIIYGDIVFIVFVCLLL